MKTVLRMPGLFVRLGTMAAVLLLGQQALAAGTDPGVSVDNRATVVYFVGGNLQTGIESSPTGNNLPGVAVPGGGADTSFVVDRRVSFTISQVGGALASTTPGDIGVFVEFYVTNTSNGLLDFVVSPTNLTSADGDVRGPGTTDSDVDMNAIRVAVSAAPDGQPGGGAAGDGPDPADPGTGLAPGDTLIDNLPEDDSIRVRIYADTPAALLNNQIANVLLAATAADPGTSVELEETPGVDDPALVENVFVNPADGNGFATETGADGFLVSSAAIVVTKTALVFSDPFGSGKAVPDAVIEYTILIDNTAGAQDATGVVVTDLVDLEVTLENGVYGADNVLFGDTTTCNADDAGDTDGDGCSFDVVTGALSITVPNVPQTTSMTVQFQVRIPPL